ncbi:putative reverse transcriptase domain-containing protein, partial [Tanacetum coccineum]
MCFHTYQYIWGEDQETAFQLLKQKLCEALILALPEGNDDFVIYCDASHQGLGAVLMQREKVKRIENEAKTSSGKLARVKVLYERSGVRTPGLPEAWQVR